METKCCRRCKQSKPSTEFFKDKKGKLRLGTICKPCNTEETREWRTKNRQYYREYCRKNRPRYAAQHRNHDLLVKYGITSSDYDALRAKQNGVCAICDRPATGKRHCSKLHVDHDHKSGKVRGLLCAGCNRMIGRVKDNPDVLRRAASYLEQGAGHDA